MGDNSLIANPDGENDRLDLAAFVACLTIKQSGSALLIFTCKFEGELIKTLCEIAPFFGGEDWNRGLGNRTVFLPHGLFLGETLSALNLPRLCLGRSLGDNDESKIIRDLARGE